MIEIHLYGKLRRFTTSHDPMGDSVVRVPIEEGDTIADVLKRIGISLEEVGSNIFRNHKYSTLSRKVEEGDRLGVFPDDMQLLYKWYFQKEDDQG